MSQRLLSSDNYQKTFAELDQLLVEFQDVWRAKPFVDDTLAWQSQYPALYQALIDLSDAQLKTLEEESQLIDWMTAYLPQLKMLSALSITRFDGQQTDMAKFADVGIPGRKKQQIVGFASALKSLTDSSGKILDWCSGKGHLAKHLHYVMGQPVTCLEYDKALCEAGEKEVTKLGYDIQFIEQDVLQPISAAVVQSVGLNTALHACGDLHVTMMKSAVQGDSEQIALSPCCYHLIRNTHYQGLSEQSRQSLLSLSKDDLRLAVLQTVTAGERVKRLRKQELIWRTAFDLLQRELTGIEHYRAKPSINKKWLSGSFDGFCLHLAQQQQLSLPQSIDSAQLLAEAEHKFNLVVRLEKARLVFRKALEYWLLLDRVLYLQEKGYAVDIRLFCEEAVTPRNALIVAIQKRGAIAPCNLVSDSP